MDENIILSSIAMTYMEHGLLQQEELEGFKYLLRDSTDKRAIQIHNNGIWYDTRKDYFIQKGMVETMREVTMYTGKNSSVKVDLDNLLGTDINVLKSIPYSVAKKYPEFTASMEVCIEDCLDVARDIHDELSYGLAVAEMCIIINGEEEETIMTTNNNATVIIDNEVLEAEVVNVEVKEVAEDTTTNKEEVKMEGTIKENIKTAVEEMMEKFVEAKENIKVNVGETKEEYIEKVDDSLNVMKGALGNVLGMLDGVLGYTVLKDSILEIMEAGATEHSSKKDLWRMAEKCRKLLEEEIENLEFWGDQDSLKKAVQLKALAGECRGKSIFEAFVSGCIWIAKKVIRKLRQWFKVDDEKSVLGAICRAIGGFAKILRAGVVFVWNTVKFAVSFVVAGAIKLVDFVCRTVMTLVSGIKEWATTKFQKVTEEDIDDDFEFEDDEE